MRPTRSSSINEMNKKYENKLNYQNMCDQIGNFRNILDRTYFSEVSVFELIELVELIELIELIEIHELAEQVEQVELAELIELIELAE